MEVKLDKRYPVPAGIDQAWAVLGDVRATAACMPGANITEQVDESHYLGTVKSRIGPAVMSFNGEIEVLARDAAARTVQLLGKGADKAGSSASMNLSAGVEPGDTDDNSVLVGRATIIVSGKLAQFGSRLLVPVSDAMLKQFADNFGKAAATAVITASPAATPTPAAATDSVEAVHAEALGATPPTGDADSVLPLRPSPARSSSPPPSASSTAAAPPQPAASNELNALGLLWTVVKGWFASLFRKRH